MNRPPCTNGRIREEHGRNIRVDFIEAKDVEVSEIPHVRTLN